MSEMSELSDLKRAGEALAKSLAARKDAAFAYANANRLHVAAGVTLRRCAVMLLISLTVFLIGVFLIISASNAPTLHSRRICVGGECTTVGIPAGECATVHGVTVCVNPNAGKVSP